MKCWHALSHARCPAFCQESQTERVGTIVWTISRVGLILLSLSTSDHTGLICARESESEISPAHVVVPGKFIDHCWFSTILYFYLYLSQNISFHLTNKVLFLKIKKQMKLSLRFQVFKLHRGTGCLQSTFLRIWPYCTPHLCYCYLPKNAATHSIFLKRTI